MNMNEQRLRTFLLLIAGWICVATPIELLLAEHTKVAVQLIPFVLCALGLVAVVAAVLLPQRPVLLGLRAVMGVLLLGSLLGVYEHLEANAEFQMEMHPSAVLSSFWIEILKGAAPLLAPGILAIAAMLALAATYAHPALQCEVRAMGGVAVKG